MATAPGKPETGFGHYLRDMVYGALDGVITTLAVISGASGAELEPRVGLILGAANLVADGVSMGASNYLGMRTELEQTGGSRLLEMPWRHGTATALAFAIVGAVPLLAYVVPRPGDATHFQMALSLAAVALGVVGWLRARYIGRASWRSILEVLALAGAAAASAYLVGAAVEQLTR